MLKKLANVKAIKANAKIAAQAALWIGLGFVAGAYLPELVISRVTFLRTFAAKSDKHRAAVKAGIGLLLLGPGVLWLASKGSKGAAAKATKYVLGGVALGAVGPLVVNTARNGVARLDGVIPGAKAALPAPAGMGAGTPYQQAFDVEALAPPGAMVFGPPDVAFSSMKALP